MPRYDHTGPQGMGPRTGRGMGMCGGRPADAAMDQNPGSGRGMRGGKFADAADQAPGNAMNQTPGNGRGMGRGNRHGQRRGMCRCGAQALDAAPAVKDDAAADKG